MTADQLKPGWRRVRFGDVVRDVKNTTRNPEADGFRRVVGLDHLDPESLPLRRWDDLADLPDGTSFTRTFRAGQVLFGKRRAYQRKVAVPDFDGICSSDILVFEPSSPDLLPDFLPYLVQSDGFFDHALGTSAGSLSPRTKWQELAKYEFALPPLDEQQRLAEILAASHVCIDGARVVAERAEGLRRATLIGHIWDSGRSDWCVPLAPVESLLLEPPRNGISPAAAPVGEGWRTVSISAVRDGEFVAGKDVLKWCLPARDVSEFQVRARDAFVVRGNGNRELVARMGLCRETPTDACLYPDLLIRVRFDPTKLLPELGTELWNLSRCHASLLSRAKSSNGIYKVNGKDVRQHRLPVPSAARQAEILRDIDAARRVRGSAQLHLAHLIGLGKGLREYLTRGDL